jgi:hypothetical protein
MWGWRPPLTTTAVGPCGHLQEQLPIPIGEDRCRLIPVLNPERRPAPAAPGGELRLR